MSKWEMVELENVCDVRDGTHDSPKYVQVGYPLITSKNISNGIIDFDNVSYILEDDYRKINQRSFVDDGDILMPMIGTIGNPVIVNKTREFAIKNVALIKFNNASALNRYVNYCLGSNLFNIYIRKENRGGTQKFLSLSNIRKFSIPLPPLDAQKHIADILDKAQEIIDGHNKQLEELDNLIKATFYDMFGDPFDKMSNQTKVLLSEISEIIMGQSPQGDTYNNEGLGTPLLNGPTEFGKVHPSEKQWTTKPTKICIKNDILFCVRGATAGKMNYADKQYCIGRGLAAIRVKDSNEREYIYSYLEMMYDYFQSTSNGSTFINIGKDQLENLPIIYPSKEKRTLFSKIVSNINEQKSIVKQSLKESQNLFNSLMNKYFD